MNAVVFISCVLLLAVCGCQAFVLWDPFDSQSLNCWPPTNKEFTVCGSACRPSCDEPAPLICTMQCYIGCVCEQGYFQTSDHRCITWDECEEERQPDALCPGNLEFQSCGTSCPATCDEPVPRCTRECAIGCFCPHGTVLRSNSTTECVSLRDCECPETMVYNECGTACEPTCDEPTSMMCTANCVEGCFCPTGTLRDGGRCVHPDDCPNQADGCDPRRCAIPMCAPGYWLTKDDGHDCCEVCTLIDQ